MSQLVLPDCKRIMQIQPVQYFTEIFLQIASLYDKLKKVFLCKLMEVPVLNVWEIVSGILLIITCLLLIVIVAMQSNRSEQQGMNAITGGDSSDSYFSKNSGRTIDAILARWTKVLGVILFVITIAVNIVSVFFK